MVKSLELFFESYNKFFRSFFFVLGESYSILAVGLQCIMKNALFLPCYGLLITYLIILSLGKKYCFEKKSGKRFEFWIQKSVRTLNGLRRQHHAIVSVLSGLSQKTLRTQLIF